MDKRKKESTSVETRAVYVAPQMDIIDMKCKGYILQGSKPIDVEECDSSDPDCV